jgi:glycosyltransferase involved in cell wall biosynthesis
LLKGIEKLSAAFVDHVIISNHLWHKTLIARSVSAEKSSVFINHVDPKVFARRERNRNDGKFIVLFPGSLQWHQGVDIAIEAFARIKPQIPNAEFHIYCGSGVIRGDLQDLARKLGVEESVKFIKAVSLDEMAQVIANADLGVVPKRADSFGNEAYSTKIMEFMSQGVPVVVSQTKIDTFYFEEGIVHFFPSGDSEAMASAMLDVYRDKTLRDSLVQRGYEYVERHGWNRKKKDYLGLIDSLATEVFADTQPAHVLAPQSSTSADTYKAEEEVVLSSEISQRSLDAEDHAPISSSSSSLSLRDGESEKHQTARV